MSKTDEIVEALQPKGFIGDFSDLLKDRIPNINLDLTRACGEVVEAAVCTKIKIIDQMGPLNLNIWNLPLAPSGSVKSLPLQNYVTPLLEKVEEILGKKVLLPSRFSIEGLIERMSWHKEPVWNEEKHEHEEIYLKNNEGAIIHDEFTTIVKGQKKDWLSDLSEFLSGVYDSSVSAYYTKNDQLQSVPDCNVSFLSLTTPYFYKILYDTFFTQGLGNRLRYVVFYPPKEEEVKPVDPKEFFSDSVEKEREQKILQFAKKLVGIYNSPIRYIQPFPDDGAADLWTAYKYEIDKEVARMSGNDVFSLMYPYYTRLPAKALKLSALYCVSENSEKLLHMNPKSEHDSLMIPYSTMELGIKQSRRDRMFFKQLIADWKKNVAIGGKVVTDSARKEHMLAIIKRWGLISQQGLSKESGYVRTPKFYQITSSLESEREIEGIRGDESVRLINKMTDEERKRQLVGNPRGNPPVFYRYIKEEKR